MAVDWKYFNKFYAVECKYLPACGEGNTMASQIVTAVVKLVYKWYNDGDVFDNTNGMDGWWNDLSSYANWLYKYVPEYQDILLGIGDCYCDGDYEDLLKELADTLLDADFLAGMEKGTVGTIYDCAGPFKFVEEEEGF